MLTSNVDELVLTAVMAVLYLLVVRFLDVNEREPLWSVGLLFALGGAAAIVLRLTVSSVLLELELIPSAALKEASRFVAIAIGIGMLSGVGRVRGWSEVTDLLDGLVYGMAAGLGFAAGDMLVRWLGTSALTATLVAGSPLAVFGRSALAGLAQGIFGAICGAGFGAAKTARSRAGRLMLPFLGLAVAIAADAGYQVLAFGNALGGSSAVVRMWLALALPVAVVVLLSIYELTVERRTIALELTDEIQTGLVTPAELALLQSFPRRQLTYLIAAVTGQLGRLWCLSALHNRQVMLALAKHRAGREPDARRRTAIMREVEVLRGKINEARISLQRSAGATGEQRTEPS